MPEPIHPADPNQTRDEQTASHSPAVHTQDFQAAAPKPTSSSNVQVPGYKVLGVLGRGGMGVVYKALQEKANRLVALKMILAGSHADSSDRLRFKAEAEAVAHLSHPNIVQLYEVGETPEGFPFFSLEYISGGTLAERLKQGPLASQEAAVVVEKIARAMQYAHERGIVHRDLKPLNILLEQAGGSRQAADSRATMKPEAANRTIGTAAASSTSVSGGPLNAVPKISDFGLAKQLDAEDGLTRTGAIMGSPAYMAPEQAFGQSKHVGPAADIYALGAILYECLTGRPPFKGATVADTLEQVRTMEPITLRAYTKEIPSDLETICLHCLHKDPQRRYASAEALAEDLRRYREGQPISVRPVSNFERTWRWCKRNPGWAAMIGVAVSLLFGIIGVLVYANIKTNKLNADIVKESERAKKGQQESMLALGLAMTEIRNLAEEALIPAKQRMVVLAKLIAELQKQVDGSAPADTIDSMRNNTYLYSVLALAENESAVEADVSTWFHTDNARSWADKGLKMVDRWLELAPGDPLALSRRANFLQLLGVTFVNGIPADTKKTKDAGFAEMLESHRKRDAYFAAALEIRRKLASDPEAAKVVDQFTPGKAKAELAESLENAKQYEEAFRVHDDLCREHPNTPNFLNNRAHAFAKAAYEVHDPAQVAKKKAYLIEANRRYAEMNERLQGTEQFTRPMLDRWAITTSRLAELEMNQNRPAEARKHLEKLALMAQHLSTSLEAPKNHYATGWAHYELARLQFKAGQDDQARASLDASRLRVELLQADYPGDEVTWNLRVSLCRLQIQLGEVAQVIRGADSLKLQFPEIANAEKRFYRLANVYSLCIPAIAKARGKGPLTDDDLKQQAHCRDKALQWLDNSLKHGYAYFKETREDEDFVPIRGDPRFEATVKKYEKK